MIQDVTYLDCVLASNELYLFLFGVHKCGVFKSQESNFIKKKKSWLVECMDKDGFVIQEQ